jgi:putative acetyltransferase
MRQEIWDLGVTHPQFHTMQIISELGKATNKQLSDRLRLEKSSVARMTKGLLENGWISVETAEHDFREKLFSLTSIGTEKVQDVDRESQRLNRAALSLLSAPQRSAVIESMQTLASAFEIANRQRGFQVRTIRPDDNVAFADVILRGLREFGAGRPGFACADANFEKLFEAYDIANANCYIIEDADGILVGGGGFAPLQGGPANIGEVQKFYILPRARGKGLAQRILNLVLGDMNKVGYSGAYLETMTEMRDAQQVYLRNGFKALDAPLGKTGHFGCDFWMYRDL